MPYKDVAKAREANRKSYRKHAVERNRRINAWIKAHPKLRRKHIREHGWSRCGIINPDGTRFRLVNYYQLLKQQNNRCAIINCIKKPDGIKKVFDVDHDHKTGRVRGLLCGSHNKILGKVNDSIDDLQELINYLRLHKSGGEK